jgi:Ca2+:H+ antiporter
MGITDNIIAARSKWKQAAKDRRIIATKTGRDLEAGFGSENHSHPRHTNTEPTNYKPRDWTPKDEKSDSTDSKGKGSIGNSDTLAASDATGASAGGDAVRNRKVNRADGDDADETETQDPTAAKESLRKQNSRRLYTPVHPREPFTVSNQIRRTLFGSWLNILILAAPAGIGIGAAGLDGRIVFAVNFVAIIPLAAMLSDATEEVALRTGETLGGLINATFG